MTRNWVAVKGSNPIKVLEDNGDGTYTGWGYSVWGPIGSQGTLKPEIIVKPITNKREREEVARLERLMDKAMRTQRALYISMGGKGLDEGTQDTKAG